MEIINSIIKTRSIFLILISIVTLGVGFSIWSFFYYSKERRLFKNIRRKVYLLGNNHNSLDFESRLLKKIGFFKICRLPRDRRSLDLVDNQTATLIILGYEPSDDFRNNLAKCHAGKIPTIIYSRPQEITKEDLLLIQNHTYHSLCNTPLRLISDVFNIMATWPERGLR